MTNNQQRFVISIGGAGVFVLGLLLSSSINSCITDGKTNEETTSDLEKIRINHEQVVTVLNKNIKDLNYVIDSKDSVIADLILKLEDQPTDVKYIVKVVEKLVPTEPEIIISSLDGLHKEYLFSLVVPDGQLVVARTTLVDRNNDGVDDAQTYQTYEQDFLLDAVLGKKSSSFLLRMKTSYDDKIHDIPVNTSVTYVDQDVKDRKIVEVGLSMNVGGYIGTNTLSSVPVAGYQAGISLPWLHPLESLDLLSPKIGIGQVFDIDQQTSVLSFRSGIDIASYNIGANDKSILNDTWLCADITIGTDLSLAGGLCIGTRL